MITVYAESIDQSLERIPDAEQLDEETETADEYFSYLFDKERAEKWGFTKRD